MVAEIFNVISIFPGAETGLATLFTISVATVRINLG